MSKLAAYLSGCIEAMAPVDEMTASASAARVLRTRSAAKPTRSIAAHLPGHGEWILQHLLDCAAAAQRPFSANRGTEAMFTGTFRKLAPIAALFILSVPAAQAAAPGGQIDGDLAKPAIAIPAVPSEMEGPPPAAAPAAAAPSEDADLPSSGLAARAPGEAPRAAPIPEPVVEPGAVAASAPAIAMATDSGGTWQKDDLIGAAQGVFGKGAAGLAEMIEDLLRKQGEPNGYIVGREGGGALFFGLRYGSGTLYHKVEGRRPVYWSGPSLGLDLGANAAKTFVLVYNLYDTEELYSRFGAGEGQAYLIGGFHVSYLRLGDKVLIPVRSGAGLRLGVNAGYMKFSHRQNWLPF